MEEIRFENDLQVTHSEKPGGGRVGYIDALKGLAMLCVVLGHVLDGYLDGNTYVEANTVMSGFFNLIYAFHMPLFMMLSGYVYCAAYPIERNPEKKGRLHRQIGNNLVVYVVYSIGFGLLKIICGGFINKPMTITNILMIWLRPISPYWYLYDLIIFYYLFSWKILRQLNKWYMLCVLLAISFASSWIGIDEFNLSSLMYYALFFYAGMVVYGLPEHLIPERRKSVFITFFIAIILCVIFWYRGSYTKEAKSPMINALPIVNVLVGMNISLTLWQIFQNKRFVAENRFLKMIGRYSLEIYVIHCVFTAGLRAVLPRMGVSNAFVSVILNTTISTTVPILISVCTKKLKIHDLIFRPVTYFAARRK